MSCKLAKKKLRVNNTIKSFIQKLKHGQHTFIFLYFLELVFWTKIQLWSLTYIKGFNIF